MLKKDQIFRKIRQEIISGVLKVGDKLPNEWEHAAIYHVSRDTIRGAMKLLEDGGFIERIKSKGTFVCLPDTSPENRTISLLVPCNEYLQQINLHFQKLLFELIACAAGFGWRITPVVFSKTNSNTDIWWENLMHFNRESRVVVYRTWFFPYFESLSAIGAHVAFVMGDCPLPESWEKYTRNWLNFIECDTVTGEDAIRKLHLQGCSKIAVALPDCYNAFNPFGCGCRKMMEALHLPPLLLNLSGVGDREAIAEYYRQTHFDGIITHFDENTLSIDRNFRENLGVPADVKIIAVPLKGTSFYLNCSPQISTVEYPVSQMAADIVGALVREQYTPQRFEYAPTIKIRGDLAL